MLHPRHLDHPVADALRADGFDARVVRELDGLSSAAQALRRNDRASLAMLCAALRTLAVTIDGSATADDLSPRWYDAIIDATAFGEAVMDYLDACGVDTDARGLDDRVGLPVAAGAYAAGRLFLAVPAAVAVLSTCPRAWRAFTRLTGAHFALAQAAADNAVEEIAPDTWTLSGQAEGRTST